jgi:hypothetical protein
MNQRHALTFALLASSLTLVGCSKGPSDSFELTSVDLSSKMTSQDILMDRYQTALSKGGDLSKTFSEQEMATIAQVLFASHEHSMIASYGNADANAGIVHVQQIVRAAAIRSGASYFEESLSYSGQAKVAHRAYQDSEKVLSYTGSVASDAESATWNSDSEKNFTFDDYAATYGKDLNVPLIYVITDETVVAGEHTSKEKTTEGGYTVNIEVDKTKGTRNYVRQMTALSGLSKDTVFDSVYLTMHLSAQLELVTMDIDEQYTAYKSILGIDAAASTHGTMTIYYHTDGTWTAPGLDANFDYSTAA